MHRPLIVLIAASLSLGGCASIVRQELQTRIGPCRREMAQWREQLGSPEETESEEDGDFYTVTWIYPERDNLEIRFEWESGGDYCEVTRSSPRI